MKKNCYYQICMQSLSAAIALLLLFVAVSVLISMIAQAQSISVRGNVSTYIESNTENVRNASVMFVKASDTTKKFYTVTDTSGAYQINITSVAPSTNVPVSFELEQNYPNPFSSSTAISYKLNVPSEVQITIFDILGREVRKISAGIQSIGPHGILWDGKNHLGERVATGIYFYRLKVRGETQVRKMVFGTGDKNVLIPLPGIVTTQTPKLNIAANAIIQAENYTAYIQNKDSTSPSIVTQMFSAIPIENDTVVNFTVIDSVPNAAVAYSYDVRQIIRGFGAANIIGPGWRPDMTAGQINTAFGTGDGQIGFTILRLRVSPDSSQFGINGSTAQKAYALGAAIVASPWTPPAWMKTNNSTIGGSLRTDAYSAYAAHLKAFADTLSNSGVPLYAVSLQNEPDANVSYESCYWNATQFLNFTKNNAAAIGTNIFMPESENFNHSFSDSTLNDPAAAANVSFIGGHLYGGGLTSYPLALSKGKEIWMTEHLVTDTSWSAVMATAKEINDCMNADMSAYIWWYIVRYYGPIHEDNHVTKRGFVMSQYSKFVRPGYYRIGATANPRSNVYVTAYKNGSSLVIVVVNNGPSVSQTFICPGVTTIFFSSYITSSSKSCLPGDDIGVINSTFTATLDSSSVTTFISN